MLSVVSILSASLLVSNSPLPPQDTSLWRYTTTQKIEFYHVTAEKVIDVNVSYL